ncbi:hypothetical protein TorRG33x02_327500 [Trema orientale]|uniref:Uncharacterized protein n=1 Tax=Trema orientale TaxID=63057 RepID=A0A2P5BAW9_TREOI|nr:hypothetical protein TorRG33x02_327500 [Trema orientale]
MSELSKKELREKLVRHRIFLTDASPRRAKPYAKVGVDIKQAAHIDLPSSSSSVSSNQLEEDHQEEDEIANNCATLKELVSLVRDQQPLCIELRILNAAFKLKSEIIHLLLPFHSFAGEDPNRHLKEFHVVYLSMKPNGISDKQIKLRTFLFFFLRFLQRSGSTIYVQAQSIHGMI